MADWMQSDEKQCDGVHHVRVDLTGVLFQDRRGDGHGGIFSQTKMPIC